MLPNRRRFLTAAALAPLLPLAPTPLLPLAPTPLLPLAPTPLPWFNVLCCDRPTGNGNIYPRATLRRAVKCLRGSLGQLGMPPGAIIWLTEVSHQVVDLRIDGDFLAAQIMPLDTPRGIILRRMLEAGAVAFRTAAYISGGTGRRLGDDTTITGIHAVNVNEAATL